MTLTSFPSIADAQLDTDSPVDTDLMGAAGLQGKDRYLWNEGFSTSLHPGVQLNVVAIAAAVEAHDHSDGVTDDGNARKIPAAGVAAGALLQSSMIEDNAISQALIAANTMQASNIGNLQVTPEKLSGSMGTHYTASPNVDTESPPGTGDYVWAGDSYTINHSKGATGVVCNMVGGSYFVAEVTSAHIKLALVPSLISPPFTGAWPGGIDLWFM